MSIRLGRSRTCFRREKLLRARGAATLLVKCEASLENGVGWDGDVRTSGGTAQRTELARLRKQQRNGAGPGRNSRVAAGREAVSERAGVAHARDSRA